MVPGAVPLEVVDAGAGAVAADARDVVFGARDSLCRARYKGGGEGC